MYKLKIYKGYIVALLTLLHRGHGYELSSYFALLSATLFFFRLAVPPLLVFCWLITFHRFGA